MNTTRRDGSQLKSSAKTKVFNDSDPECLSCSEHSDKRERRERLSAFARLGVPL